MKKSVASVVQAHNTIHTKLSMTANTRMRSLYQQGLVLHGVLQYGLDWRQRHTKKAMAALCTGNLLKVLDCSAAKSTLV